MPSITVGPDGPDGPDVLPVDETPVETAVPLEALLPARTRPARVFAAAPLPEPAVSASTTPASTTGSEATTTVRRRRPSLAANGRSFRIILHPPGELPNRRCIPGNWPVENLVGILERIESGISRLIDKSIKRL
jgi:hypothetical protein